MTDNSLESYREMFSTDLGRDSGKMTAAIQGLERYVAFGAVVKEYQKLHPELIVRTVQRMDRKTWIGTITVSWWPVGSEEPQ